MCAFVVVWVFRVSVKGMVKGWCPFGHEEVVQGSTFKRDHNAIEGTMYKALFIAI